MLIRFSVLILLYSTARVLFFAYNRQALQDASAVALVGAFLTGFRADLIGIVLTNSILIPLALLRRFVRAPWYEKFLNVVFLVCNLPFLVINVVDLEYFEFTGERSSLKLWDVSSDIPFQLGNFIIHYWHLALIAAGFIFLSCFFLPDGSAKRTAPARWKRSRITCGLLLICLLIFGADYAVQKQITGAGSGDDPALRQLAQNSTLTLLSSQSSCGARLIGRDSSEEPPLYSVAEPSTRSRQAGARDNVVIIIVESLSTEYTGIGRPSGGYAPFLTQLANTSVSFANHFANARRSIDALPSILLGLPHLSAATFRCAKSRHLDGLASILSEEGYKTLFFHGGRNGAGDFDGFAKQTGFARYYGANEYGHPKDSDGIWGIYDEPFLRFAAQELYRQREPFVAVIFTLSTHQPFKIPAHYDGRFPRGELAIHESVGYLDHALRNFFAIAEQMAWFNRTLFVITGDHTGPAAGPRSRLIDAYRVPLIFYHPTVPLPFTNANKVTQHADITASILDHLGLRSARLPPFGRSVFDPNYEGMALGEVGNRYWIALGDHYLEQSPDGRAMLSYLRDTAAPLVVAPKVQERLLRQLEMNVARFNNLFAPPRPHG
jgi:hypothetical protein